MRSGSYNATKPDWRGVIYQDSWGVFRCTHRDHAYQQEATRCARAAYVEHKEMFKADQCPPGWEPMGRSD
jgi:hypothetical protein